MSLKIIFAGTPAFAVPTLQALVNSSHDVVAVYTQPDRPAGRGRHLTASPVKAFALEHNIPVEQPPTLTKPEPQQGLEFYNADVMVVAAYGLLLPEAVLHAPRFGCINVHASLLPRWRGAAPIHRAILAGDTCTGITIMQMEKGLDTGPMLCQASCPIERHDTSANLHDRLATLGADALLMTLTQLEAGALNPQLQNNSHATYAKKITKAEAGLDWQQTALALERQIHAFNPWPVATTSFISDPTAQSSMMAARFNAAANPDSTSTSSVTFASASAPASASTGSTRFVSPPNSSSVSHSVSTANSTANTDSAFHPNQLQTSPQTLRVWEAQALSNSTACRLGDLNLGHLQPGTLVRVVPEGMDVVTGGGVLRLLSVQLPGGRRILATDFIHSHQKLLHVGCTLFFKPSLLGSHILNAVEK